jgi:cytochrome c oxidase subunit 2
MITRLSRMKHLIIALILVFVVTGLLFVGLNYVQLLPVAASEQAKPIDALFGLEFKVIAFLFSLIVVFMVYSILVFRRKRGDLTDAANVKGNTRLEVAWTLAPLVTVLVFAYLGGDALAKTVAPEPKPLRVEVVGRQWSWSFAYPDYGVTSNELYLPLDRQALLSLSSQDVIHSFWVPEFRVKQDLLPGGQDFVRELRITPDRLGDYKVRCAEMCGLHHAEMVAPVKVVSQEDFETWITKEASLANDPAARGAKYAGQFGCLACHSVNGSKMVGPTWQGLFGKQETLADGSTVTVDEAYLRDSILNPNSQIVKGYPAKVMSSKFIDSLTNQPISDAQINDIIAYIISLAK